MGDIEFIKDFLRDKDGYLKSGNLKVAEQLNKKYGKHFSIDDIKAAKKAVKKEYKNLNNMAKPIVVEQPKAVDPELLARFNEIAKELGLKGVTAITSEENEVSSFLKRKRSLYDMTPPKLDDQVGMHIMLGCNHVPFHHKELHKNIRKMIKDHQDKIVGFHLMGDFLDLNPLSFHDKGKFTAVPGLTLNDEYDAGRAELHSFLNVLPKKCWKTYLYGNHEDRHNRWMKVMDNAKTPLPSPEEGLGLWEKGFQVKNSWSQDYFTIGKDFDIFHGIYFSIHNAKAHLDKLRRNCAYVHTHRQQMFREGKMAAFNIGACADFTSKAFNYATRPMKAQWANGFAINMVDDNHNSNVTQINVNPDGGFYFGGKLYK